MTDRFGGNGIGGYQPKGFVVAGSGTVRFGSRGGSSNRGSGGVEISHGGIHRVAKVNVGRVRLRSCVPHENFPKPGQFERTFQHDEPKPGARMVARRRWAVAIIGVPGNMKRSDEKLKAVTATLMSILDATHASSTSVLTPSKATELWRSCW